MFKRLHIKNHKSHEDSVFDFVPGVNVIVGRPQSGKSNIIRSFKLLVSNRPTGAAFWPDFAGSKGQTYHEIETSEGDVITQTKEVVVVKGKKKLKANGTKYTLNGNESSGLTDEITRALNISSLNIHNQFDVPYLTTSTYGEIAKIVNKITNLEDADIWQKDLASRLRKVNSKIEDAKRDIKKDKKSLKSFEGIDRIEHLLGQIRILEKKRIKFEGSYLELSDLYCELEEDQIVIERLNRALEALSVVTEAESVSVAGSEALEEIQILNSYLGIGKEIKDSEKLLSRLEEAIQLYDKAVSFDQECVGIGRDIVELENYIVNADEMTEVEKEREDMAIEFTDLMLELNTCPLCLSEINKETVENILEEM